MCGLCGIVDFSCQPSIETVEEMNAALRHRGPDAGGVCSFASCGLGHRRLSILDLSDSANQPMLSSDGMIALVFNGEIYNFQENRRRLESAGHRFRTRSDTEVILELYIEKQEALVEDLNGMFSLAIWDERKKSLFFGQGQAWEEAPILSPTRRQTQLLVGTVFSDSRRSGSTGNARSRRFSSIFFTISFPAPTRFFATFTSCPRAIRPSLMLKASMSGDIGDRPSPRTLKTMGHSGPCWKN